MAAVDDPSIRYLRLAERPTRRLLAVSRPCDARAEAIAGLLAEVVGRRHGARASAVDPLDADELGVGG